MAIYSLNPPKQIALFYGPGLYQPDKDKKVAALKIYQQLISYLIPIGSPIIISHIWRVDLHGENIFVDPENPQIITGMIDWQTYHICPLISHNHDPAFLGFGGLEPENLKFPPEPD